MSGVVSLLATPVSLMLKMLDAIRKYQKKKRTEYRFVKAFENEIRTYLAVFRKINETSERKIDPIIESLEDELTVHTMNELLENMSEVPLMFAELVEAFISFAKACSEVSVLKGFMDDLKDTNIVLYDYVFTMKNAYVEENRLVIDAKYYRFFKTYESEIFGKVDFGNLDEIHKQMKRFVKKIRHFMEKTAFIKRQVRKKYRRNLRVLVKAVENVTIKKALVINLRAYVPEKLLPLAVLIEDFALKTYVPLRK